MRANKLLYLSLVGALAACGPAPADLDVEGQGVARESLLAVGTSADAILGQLQENGRRLARTDAGSLHQPYSVAVTTTGHLWVADRSNNRVLGYQNATSAADGAQATVVINQADFATTNFRNVPSTPPFNQQVTPNFISVDPEDRLYITDGSRVLVYEDPFSSDAVMDYELSGVPGSIRTVRALSNVAPLVAVVGATQIVLYQRGSADPLRTASVPAYAAAGSAYGCGDFRDVAESTGALLVACNGNVLCTGGTFCCLSDGTGTCDVNPADTVYPDPSGPYLCAGASYGCPGVQAYPVSLSTGFVNQPSEPYFAYTNSPGDLAIVSQGGKLFVVEPSRNRIVRFDSPGSWVKDKILAVPVGESRLYPPASRAPAPSPTDPSHTSHDAVFGQTTSTGTAANQAVTYDSGETKSRSDTLYTPLGIALSSANNMWVADTNNERVLRFNGATSDALADPTVLVADGILGQKSFLGRYPNRLEIGSVSDPVGVALTRSGSLVGAYVVDRNTNRVLGYQSILDAQNGEDPDFMLGQEMDGDPPPYLLNGGNAGVSANGLNHPTRVAVSPLGVVFVSDVNNNRVLAYEYISTGTYSATRSYGASDTGSTGSVFISGPGALAASNTHLYVADGSRVIVFTIATTGNGGVVAPYGYEPLLTYSTWAFGQPDSRTNDCNHGGLGPDTLCTVTGLAVDANDSRLWIADSWNDRVLWFDDPLGGTAVDATTADGVVGQRNFVTNGAWAGIGAAGYQYGFWNDGLIDIAVDDQGTLWAADTSANRVLGFATPTEPDENYGMPIATTVIGQSSFNRFDGADDTTVNARNLKSPVAVAVNGGGNVLLVSDAGDYRVMRYVDNLPPRVSGAGEYQVALGNTKTVQLVITDPENLGVTLGVADGFTLPTGVTVSGTSVTFVATDPTLRLGDTVRVSLVATDAGAPPKSTQVSLAFKLVQQTTSVSTPSLPSADAPPEPSGCGCASSSSAGLPYLAVLLMALGWRRRRIVHT